MKIKVGTILVLIAAVTLLVLMAEAASAATTVVLVPQSPMSGNPDSTAVNEGNWANIQLVKVNDSAGQMTPMGIAAGPDSAPNHGLVYIADYYNDRIQWFDGQGNYKGQFGSYGTGPGGLIFPYGIAVNNSGYIYVTDATNCVKVFKSDGTFAYSFNAVGTSGSLNGPRGIAVNLANGNVYVADSGNNRIVEYDNAGNYVSSISSYSYPHDGTQYFSAPTGVAVNSTGYVFVTDTGNNLIKVFTGNLNYFSQFSSDVLAVKYPLGIAIDHDDEVLVVDNNNYRVVAYNKYDQATGIVLGSYGTSPGQFTNPRMIACYGSSIYVTDSSLNNVTEYGTDGSFDRTWGGQFATQPVTAYYQTYDGNATAPQNYTAASGSVTFAPNEFVKTVSVQTVSTAGYKPNKYFTIGLTSVTNGVIGNSYPANTIWILNTHAFQPTVQFNAVSYPVSETTGSVTLTVTLAVTTTQTVTVNYHTVNGTALAGQNYTNTSGTLTFAPGETSKTITVPILNTPGYNPDASFFVALDSPVNAVYGYPSVAVVNILNADPQASIHFSAAAYNVHEDAGPATLTVVRSGDLTFASQVFYYTSDGSAKFGQNYTAASGTLTFAPGDASEQITVPVIDTPGYNPDAAFTVTLSPVSNAMLGSPSVATVNILNVDPQMMAGFNQSAYTVWENASSVVLNLTLTGTVGTDVTVTYKTTDGTAKDGVNYTGTQTGSATIPAGQLYTLITMPVIDNLCNNTNPFFYVNITGVNGFAGIGTPNVANVTIVDNDYAFTIKLYKGWNLISIPVVIVPIKASDLCAMDITNISMVMAYDNTQLKYDLYTIGAPAEYNFSVQTDYGYLVYSSNNTNITFVGTLPVGRSIALTKSYNMIGWSTFDTSSASAICALIPGNVQNHMVMMYDAQNHVYKLYSYGAPSNYDFAMRPGSGYLLYSDTVTTFNYGGI